MLLYVSAGVVLLCFLIIRAIRGVGFYQKWKDYPEGIEKRAAFWNFFIHLLIVLALLAGILVLAGRVYWLKKQQDFYRQIVHPV